MRACIHIHIHIHITHIIYTHGGVDGAQYRIPKTDGGPIVKIAVPTSHGSYVASLRLVGPMADLLGSGISMMFGLQGRGALQTRTAMSSSSGICHGYRCYIMYRDVCVCVKAVLSTNCVICCHKPFLNSPA